MQSDLEKIKAVVHGLIPDSRVILFGSRARNTHDERSDYDIMVVTKNDYDDRTKIQLRNTLFKLLGKARIPSDVILKSEKDVLQKIELPGNILKTVFREGILL
jgi:hypothetical protein